MKTSRGSRAILLRPKELSWLQFNERVLEEARSSRHPLWDRLRFLAIYSNNLDEFYRVRVANLQRLESEEGPSFKVCGTSVRKILREIRTNVGKINDIFERTWFETAEEMEREGIRIVDESTLSLEQTEKVRAIFQREVRSRLVPILLARGRDIPLLHDHVVHLAVRLEGVASTAPRVALIEIPSDTLPRFWILPPAEGKECVILLEDIVRFGLRDVFSLFSPRSVKAWAFKVTRDAELDLDEPFVDGYLRRVHHGLKKRAAGKPVRLVHDRGIPDEILSPLLRKLDLTRVDARIPGMRYHNFKDFMGFPKLGRPQLGSRPLEPLPHPDLVGKQSSLAVVSRKDVLLHFPYQSFDHFLDLLREAAIDPEVTHIRLTVYRVSQESSVLNALLNAARNGKKVTVLLEVLARFDEENNIEWADILRDEGVEVILGVRGLKVHAKLCLITRRDGRKTRHFAAIGTGNFNEETAHVYTDHLLLTSDPAITDEIAHVFEFFRNNYKVPNFRHLIVSPFGSRDRLVSLIDAERRNAKAGRQAWIRLRLNNLADEELIASLVDASRAGVDVRILVRGMYSLAGRGEGTPGSIEARSLVGRYLEHSRALMFCNDGKPLAYTTSADWMARNMDGRVEIACPIRDRALRKQLLDYFDLQWRDDVNARLWDTDDANRRLPHHGKSFDAQLGIREWLREEAYR